MQWPGPLIRHHHPQHMQTCELQGGQVSLISSTNVHSAVGGRYYWQGSLATSGPITCQLHRLSLVRDTSNHGFWRGKAVHWLNSGSNKGTARVNLDNPAETLRGSKSTDVHGRGSVRANSDGREHRTLLLQILLIQNHRLWSSPRRRKDEKVCTYLGMSSDNLYPR